MRMGDIPLVPYYRPGDDRIARDLAALAARHQAFLLANHGPVVCGENLQEAANNTEELEETAKLIFYPWRTPDSLFNHRRNCAVKEITRCRVLPPICR
ncbi:sugar aldolase [Salmonella enterica]|uniref:Sugar aldolase n=1 Tax=Salmonella sp. NCTC 6947 TaxID=2583581 RepID=A0A509BII7_9ENTR|nr:sugar aldolase [Salmonella enterica]